MGYLSEEEIEVLSALIPIQQAGVTDLCLALNLSSEDVEEAAIRLKARGFIGFRNHVLWITSYMRLQGSLAGKGLWWLVTLDEPNLRGFLRLKSVYYAPFSIQLMDVVDAFCIAKGNVFTSLWRADVGSRMILRTLSPILIALKKRGSPSRLRSLLDIVKSSLNLKLSGDDVKEVVDRVIHLFAQRMGVEPARIWEEVEELSRLHIVRGSRMSPCWRPKGPLRILVLRNGECLALPNDYKGRRIAKRLSNGSLIFRGYPLKPIKLLSFRSSHREYERRLMRILNKLPYAMGEGDLRLLAAELFDLVKGMMHDSLTSIRGRELSMMLAEPSRRRIYSIAVRALNDIRRRTLP